MLFSVLAGFLTGFIVSIPPLGPISFALISKGFRSRIKEGLAIALGAAVMDCVYALIAFGGISLFISLLPESAAVFYRENSFLIQVILTYTGCFLVIIYGIKIMRTKETFTDIETKQSEKIQTAEEKAVTVKEKAFDIAKEIHVPVNHIKETNLSGEFFLGVMLCLSSITLPASWIALVGYFKTYKIIDSSFLSGFLFSIAALVGTWFWFYVLLRLITGNKHRINPNTINKLNIAAGIILFLLGLFLFSKATVTLFHII